MPVKMPERIRRALGASIMKELQQYDTATITFPDGTNFPVNLRWEGPNRFELRLEDESFESLPEEKPVDLGAHYRFHYRGIQIDPYRIASVYGITNHAQFHVLKKVLCAGKRGQKDLRRDIDESINALQRWREMLDEDEI